MEVYHKLRVFENQEASQDTMFPYIYATLDIAPPDEGDAYMDLKFAAGDSVYDSSSTQFDTKWASPGVASSEGSDNRLYLYGYGYGTEYKDADIDKSPHFLVTSTKGSDIYNSKDSDKYASNEYYILAKGAVEEYIDVQTNESSIIPADLGYVNGTKRCDWLLASSLRPVIYGPFTRTIDYMKEQDIDGVKLNIPTVYMHHVGMSHWIDTSMLVRCDPTSYYAIPDGSDCPALFINTSPNEYCEKMLSSKLFDMSYNQYLIDHTESPASHIDRRCDCMCISSTKDAGIIFRAKPSQATSFPYRVYICSIFGNPWRINNIKYNSEFTKMFSGTMWDWVNVQIWDGDIYLSADCFISYSRSDYEAMIEFDNVIMYQSSNKMDDDTALSNAQSKIKAAKYASNRLDAYVLCSNDDALICTTELASNLSYNPSWVDESDYVESFDENGERYEGGQDYKDAPDDMSMQYKIYASTQTPMKDSISYECEGVNIKDEFHLVTSVPYFINCFTKVHYISSDADYYEKLLPEECYIGIKWDDAYYDPILPAASNEEYE